MADKKKPAIEKAEAEYKKIIDLQPDAPPKWVIAAGSRVGLMWGDFVDDFRSAPIPEAWKKDAELRGVYYDALGRQEPADQGSEGEAGAQELPRLLGQVPVLRRVLARLRGVAREELQVRIPRRRRAPRRHRLCRTAVSTTSRRRSRSGGGLYHPQSARRRTRPTTTTTTRRRMKQHRRRKKPKKTRSGREH